MGLQNWLKRLCGVAGDERETTLPKVAGSGKSGLPGTAELEVGYKRQLAQDLDGAEKIYRSLLEKRPDDIRALHLLGALHGQKGNAREAAKHLERAAELSPGDANVLADLARVRAMEGRFEPAESLLRRAIDLAPDEANHHFSLAHILIQNGSAGRAIDSLCRAVQINSGFVDAYSDLGAAYLETGHLAEAKVALESAIRLDNGCIPARMNLAHLDALSGEFNQAVARYQAILATDPNNENALSRMGQAYVLAGEDENALRCFEELVTVTPHRFEHWNQLGSVAQKLGLHLKAVECFEHSLEIEATQPETLVNLGTVSAQSGNLERSAACFESAIALREDLESAYHNLGATYLSQGRHREAFEAYKTALGLAPHSRSTLSNLIAISLYRDGQDKQDIASLLDRYLKSLAPERILGAIPSSHDRTPNRRLKVAYVSPDFVQHSVSYFIEPAVAGHDRKLFEVFCYSDVASPDRQTERLRSAADCWRDIFGKDHDSVAALVRRDQIDILVDLAGHSAGNRLPVFAQRPAPIQISYLGYPGTTGLPEIDYRLTDAVSDPPGDSESAYAEKLVRFCPLFLCYEPPVSAPPLSTGQHSKTSVCFGSFNELPKISPPVVRTWARILDRIPESTLLLKTRAFADEGTRARVVGWFADAGVEVARLELVARTPSLEAHLAMYARVDIALDTFPYNGTTTTCEALYMGVPVVTLRGDSHVSRVGASLLTAMGLDALITESEDAYIKTAVSLAEDRASRIRMHETLRTRMLSSPLTDKRAFVENLQSIYLQVWKTWCDGAPVSSSRVARPQNESFDEITGAIRLNTMASYPIWLPGNLNRLTTYVHCEQESWFEDEFQFLRSYLDNGMRVLDIGANYGVYSLMAAGQVGQTGCVWSVEPASITYRWLTANVRYNDCDNTRLVNVALSNFNGLMKLQVFPDAEYNRLGGDETNQGPGELVDVRRLDNCVADSGISNIDLVKIDAEGAEKQILDGGARFFVDETPLVMFEIQSGSEPDWSLVEKFQSMGYSVFRLVPGLGCLVPVGESGALDPYTLNLFACRRERLTALSERGLLISQVSAKRPATSPDQELVWRYFESRAFSRDCVEDWRSGVDELDIETRERLLRVLGRYVAAHDGSAASGAAFDGLTQAYDDCIWPDSETFGPVFRIVKARLAAELGLRIRAARILEPLLESEDLRGPWCARIPFLPASSRFDDIAPESRIHDWCDASVLDAYLRLSAFSTLFMKADRLQLMERLRQTGFERPEMERRRLLLSARHGCETEAPSERLRMRSADNLNPEFWKKFRPELLHSGDAD